MFQGPFDSLLLEKNLSNKDPWHEATNQYLKDQPVDFFLYESLLEKLLKKPINHPSDAIVFFKKCLSLLIFKHDKDALLHSVEDELKNKIEKITFLSSSALMNLLKRLILSDGSSYELPSIYDKNFHSQLPIEPPAFDDLAFFCDTALFAFILAQKNQDKNLQNEAKKLAIWLSSFLDSNHFPFFTLFANESHFSISQKLSSFYLLFYFLEKNLPIESRLISNQLLQYLLSFSTSLPLFSIILTKWFSTTFQNSFNFSKGPLKVFTEEKMGLGVFHFNMFEGAFSFSGIKSGLGQIHLKDVRILSFGPKFFPLDDMKSYGIFRPAFEKESFSDLKYSFIDNLAYMEGWVRLCEKTDLSSKGSSSWLKCLFSAENEKVVLEFSRIYQLNFPSYLIVFFIHAKSAIIDTTSILPSTLDKYLGSNPRFLSFRGKEASINFNFENIEKIHVIPLASKPCFFEANFLLAIEPRNKGPTTITLKRG